VEHFARAGLDASSVSPSYGLAENCTCPRRGAEQYQNFGAQPPLLLPSAPEPQGTEIEIVVDVETYEPVEDGVEGEIWLSSPGNTSGYLGHHLRPARRSARACRRDQARASCGRAIGAWCAERSGYLYVLGRSADAIATNNGQRCHVHAHYVETAAFASAPDALRGGCVAAFTTSPSSVAELQKARGSNKHLMSDICDGIRLAVWNEEGIRVAPVVLVESGELPKTTSGKLRRWSAREKLIAGELPNVFVARSAGNTDASIQWRRIEN
jgi:acyl-CoA synthetase (AMP-forming)/AMP-acid ligase II